MGVAGDEGDSSPRQGRSGSLRLSHPICWPGLSSLVGEVIWGECRLAVRITAGFQFCGFQWSLELRRQREKLGWNIFIRSGGSN